MASLPHRSGSLSLSPPPLVRRRGHKRGGGRLLLLPRGCQVSQGILALLPLTTTTTSARNNLAAEEDLSPPTWLFSAPPSVRETLFSSFHRPLPIRTVDDNGRKARYNHFRSAPKLERRETHSTKLFPFSISFYPPTPLSPSVLWTTDLTERDEGGEERRFLLLFLSLSLLQCLLLPSSKA